MSTLESQYEKYLKENEYISFDQWKKNLGEKIIKGLKDIDQNKKINDTQSNK